MKKIIIGSVLVILVLVIVSLLFLRKGAFHYSGVMEAVEIDLPARISDSLKAVYAEEGDKVVKEQLLAEFDCGEIGIKEDIARKEYERAARLLKTTAGSQENYDLKKSNYDHAALYKSWCEIKSPIAGKILYKYYEPGEFVPAGRKVFTVADLSKIDAWVYVEHNKLASLRTGMKVIGYLPEADKTFEGVISTINDEAEFTPKNVQTRKERERLVYGVKTRFVNDENLTLKPGMTLEVSF